MRWPEKDEFGLDLIVEADGGERHPVDARSVVALTPFPDGIEFLALYLDWRGRF